MRPLRLASLLITAIFSTCGGSRDAGTPDAAINAPGADAKGDSPGGGPVQHPFVGPLLELPRLAPIDPAYPFNHSNEPSIVAQGGHVVIAYVNRHYSNTSSYELDLANLWRRVALAVSHDRGESFQLGALPALDSTEWTTDPVVRATADGQLWLGQLLLRGSRCHLDSSADHGDTWANKADVACRDKDWIAVDDSDRSVYLTAEGGMWKYGFDGALLASNVDFGYQAFAGYAADGRSHFLLPIGVYAWDGVASPTQEGNFPFSLYDGAFHTMTSISMGKLLGGRQWVVLAVNKADKFETVARVRWPPNDEGSDIVFSDPGSVALMPAAALDGAGRLHAIWYESNGPVGVLKYTRSLSSDLEAGFAAPLVIDSAACPGNGWYPIDENDDPSLNAALREYIGLAIDENRAYLAWTHAPSPPARVYTTYVELE